MGEFDAASESWRDFAITVADFIALKDLAAAVQQEGA